MTIVQGKCSRKAIFGGLAVSFVLFLSFIKRLVDTDTNSSGTHCFPTAPAFVHVDSMSAYLYPDLPHGQEFSKDYEKSRRKARASQVDMWHTFVRQMKVKGDKDFKFKDYTEDLMTNMREHHLEAMANFETARRHDGYDTYRLEEAASVSKRIQKKMKHLQNPPDCSKAKVLVCNRKETWTGYPYCGWGCMIHHALYCLTAAFASNRLMLLDESFWRMDKHFQTLSPNCSVHGVVPDPDIHWPEQPSERAVRILPYSLKGQSNYSASMPPFLPEGLADRIIRLSPDPVAWFVSQYVAYLLRPTLEFRTRLDAKLASIFGRHDDPLPAIHVRRTDKSSEALYYPIEEYMYHVEEYLAAEEVRRGEGLPRRVFVATDDPDVIRQLKQNYSHYEVLANTSVAKSATQYGGRYDAESLEGTILDIHVLAHSDFLVCTMSSNVCRLAYELRLAVVGRHWERDHVVSLDGEWYVHALNGRPVHYLAHHYRVKGDDTQLDFVPQDVVAVPEYWSQPDQGYNYRTMRGGRFLRSGLQELYEVSDKYPRFV